MSSHHRRSLSLEAIQERIPGSFGLRRVHVGPGGPARFDYLGRIVKGVAQNNGPLALRVYHNAHVAGGVARRGQRRQLAGQGVLALHQLQHAQLLQGPDAIGGVGEPGADYLGIVAR